MSSGETVFVSNPLSVFEAGRIKDFYKDSLPNRSGCVHTVSALRAFFAVIEALCLYEKTYFTFFLADHERAWVTHSDPIIAKAVDIGAAEIITPYEVAKKEFGIYTASDIPDDVKHFFDNEHTLEFNLANAMSGLVKTEIEQANGGLFDPYNNFWRSFASASLMKKNAFFSGAHRRVEKNLRGGKNLIGQSIVERLYRDIEGALQTDIAALEEYTDTVPVELPPLALVVLDSAKSEDDLVDAVFRVRQDMSEVRATLAGFEKIISDPDLPLKDRLAARNELSRFSEILRTPFSSSDISEITEWKDLSAFLDFDSLSEGKIAGALLGKPTREAVRKLRERKIRHFIDMKSRIYNLAGYDELLKKKTGIDLSKFPKSELDYALEGGTVFDEEQTKQLFAALRNR